MGPRRELFWKSFRYKFSLGSCVWWPFPSNFVRIFVDGRLRGRICFLYFIRFFLGPSAFLGAGHPVREGVGRP